MYDFALYDSCLQFFPRVFVLPVQLLWLRSVSFALGTPHTFEMFFSTFLDFSIPDHPVRTPQWHAIRNTLASFTDWNYKALQITVFVVTKSKYEVITIKSLLTLTVTALSINASIFFRRSLPPFSPVLRLAADSLCVRLMRVTFPPRSVWLYARSPHTSARSFFTIMSTSSPALFLQLFFYFFCHIDKTILILSHLPIAPKTIWPLPCGSANFSYPGITLIFLYLFRL